MRKLLTVGVACLSSFLKVVATYYGDITSYKSKSRKNALNGCEILSYSLALINGYSMAINGNAFH